MDIGNLANGISKTITFDVKVLGSAAGTSIVNTAKVEGEDIDNKTEPEAEAKDKGSHINENEQYSEPVKTIIAILPKTGGGILPFYFMVLGFGLLLIGGVIIKKKKD